MENYVLDGVKKLYTKIFRPFWEKCCFCCCGWGDIVAKCSKDRGFNSLSGCGCITTQG